MGIESKKLYHVGVLGMHWGRRKGSTSSTKSNPFNKTSQDRAVANLLKKKKVAELTNADLKKINDRLQLEKSYNDLTKVEKSTGRKFVEDILLNVGKQQITTFLNKKVGDLIAKKLTGP